ncbi:hypothetical protein V5799_003855 [Amblyomma americanum]|uniref:Uncharacterized protein n=1 Tax=Amblyomma americanum TaxID=6943 RepID=A0AAQ4D7S4_AMBAM
MCTEISSQGALGTKVDEDHFLRSTTAHLTPPAHLSFRQSFSGQRAGDEQPAEGGQTAAGTRQQQPTAPPASAVPGRPLRWRK